jgi:hypothetical protein
MDHQYAVTKEPEAYQDSPDFELENGHNYNLYRAKQLSKMLNQLHLPQDAYLIPYIIKELQILHELSSLQSFLRRTTTKQLDYFLRAAQL